MRVGTNLAWSRHRFLTLLLKHPAQVLAGVSSLTSFLWLFCKRARGPAWPSGVHVSVRRVCSLCVRAERRLAKTLRPEPREGERVADPVSAGRGRRRPVRPVPRRSGATPRVLVPMILFVLQGSVCECDHSLTIDFFFRVTLVKNHHR